MRVRIEGHLLLFHRFEQRALGFRRRPVDFIGQHELREDRARMKLEGAGLALVNRCAKQIRRQQVAGELDALKLQSQRTRQCVRQRGLADAGNILNQQVSPRQHASHCQAQLAVLAKNALVELRDKRLEAGIDRL